MFAGWIDGPIHTLDLQCRVEGFGLSVCRSGYRCVRPNSGFRARRLLRRTPRKYTDQAQPVVATPQKRGVEWDESQVWGAVATGRPAMQSPGRPPRARGEHRRMFWSAIARGAKSTDAALEAGVSPVLGTRWFRECGGVTPRAIYATDSGRYLSFAEREQIALWRAQEVSRREIARRLGRSASTISRELRRNASTRGGTLTYRATVAQWHRDRRAARPKTAKLARNTRLGRYVQERLSGKVTTEHGRTVDGPSVPATAPQPLPARGPPMGPGLEPAADLGAAADRSPARPDDADLTRGHLPGHLHQAPRRAGARAAHLPADRARAAGATSAHPPRPPQPRWW